MNPKKFLLTAIIFFIAVFSSFDGISLERNISKETNSFFTSEIPVAGFTYEKVLIDGEWWIIVYDDKGNVIDEYPAE